MKTMPPQRRGKSNQVVVTPTDFMRAVKRIFVGRDFDVDLAATVSNAKAPTFYTEQDDSLIQDWSAALGRKGQAWLNPPYANIEDWVAKCARTQLNGNARIFVLVPAAVGSRCLRTMSRAMRASYSLPSAFISSVNPEITLKT